MQTSRDEIQASATDRPQIEIGSATHVGRVRANNEDSYRVVPSLNLLVLSDGIGGQANGEVASAMAVETIVNYCLGLTADRLARNGAVSPSVLSPRADHLVQAVELANRAIYGASAHDPQFQGMGATLVAAWLDGFRLTLVHVGDSRAYLLRAGELECLTADHTLVAEQVRSGLLTVEQAQTNPLRRLLIRALGAREEVETDIHEGELRSGDALLLCTDGLTGMVPESGITEILQRARDTQSAADDLVSSANEHGGEDNVSVIVLRITGNT